MNPHRPPADSLFWESRVAESLGVSRTRLRLLRKQHLTPEADFVMHDGAVVLTEPGLAKIRAVLGGEPPAAPTPAPEVAQNESAAAPLSSPSPEEKAPATANGGPVVVPSGRPERRHFMVVRKPVFRADSPSLKILLAREVEPGTAPVSAWAIGRVKGLRGPERTIRVRDNTNFLPGMILEAAASGLGVWQYVGRLPRRPGRW